MPSLHQRLQRFEALSRPQCFVIRNARLPALEKALSNSGYVWVRTNCARELVLEGRPSGFAFIVDAIEQNRRYKDEMMNFIRRSFPELRNADGDAVLTFVKKRVN